MAHRMFTLVGAALSALFLVAAGAAIVAGEAELRGGEVRTTTDSFDEWEHADVTSRFRAADGTVAGIRLPQKGGSIERW